MPVLAICRGSQVLNVARGGDLVQHLPEVVGDEKHKHTPGTFADHDVTIEEGTRLGVAARRPRAGEVASPSGNRAGRRGPTVRRTPRTERSKRSRIRTRRFAVGVLWHPEAGEDARLFEELVREAAQYRGAQRIDHRVAMTN